MSGRTLTTIETIDEAIRRLEAAETFDEDEDSDEAWTWALAALGQARQDLEAKTAEAAALRAFVREYLETGAQSDHRWTTALYEKARALLAGDAGGSPADGGRSGDG